MRETDEFVHLTSAAWSAARVRDALRMLGREEEVLHCHDLLGIGPLVDVDGDRVERMAWWSRLEGRPLTDEESARFDDSVVWESLRGSARPVVVWHGPVPTERLLVSRACWHLREHADRVYQVVLEPNPLSDLPAFYDAVGIVEPAALAVAWATCHLVPSVARLADEWLAVRSRPGECVRELDADRLVELPVSAYDDRLAGACAQGWSPSQMVVGRVLAVVPCGDRFLRWRIRELLASGEIEGRGTPLWIDLPKELRAARKP